jgi:tetratricopeptide (TPR) repeat protein
LDDLVKAYAMAGAALAAGDASDAMPYLEWAKSVAGRSSSVREALGIARYQLGDFAAAAAELATYRRLSGRQDQNHLLADCARATGHPERVAEYIEAMTAASGVPRDRLVEGYVVLAGAAGDRGDWEAAFAALALADLSPVKVEVWHRRVWYAAADLAERAGDPSRAREYLEAVLAVDPDYLDAAERLEDRKP